MVRTCTILCRKMDSREKNVSVMKRKNTFLFFLVV